MGSWTESEKDMQIALRDANTYADQKNLEMYKYIDGQIKEIAATLGVQAVQSQANKDSFDTLHKQMAADKEEAQREIGCESETRKSADDIIIDARNGPEPWTFLAQNAS